MHVAPDRVCRVVVDGTLDGLGDLVQPALLAPERVHLEVERHLRVRALHGAAELERPVDAAASATPNLPSNSTSAARSTATS